MATITVPVVKIEEKPRKLAVRGPFLIFIFIYLFLFNFCVRRRVSEANDTWQYVSGFISPNTKILFLTLSLSSSSSPSPTPSLSLSHTDHHVKSPRSPISSQFSLQNALSTHFQLLFHSSAISVLLPFLLESFTGGIAFY